MQDVHVHMFPLQLYVTQMRYMQRGLIKLYKMSLQTFIARVNEINDWIEHFPPRDDKTPQIKLADN
eukprot:585691-Ditylum_brightwellii.AAC.1